MKKEKLPDKEETLKGTGQEAEILTEEEVKEENLEKIEPAPIAPAPTEVVGPDPGEVMEASSKIPPVRPSSLSPLEKFIYSLFSNGDKPYLKDRDAAAKDAGITPLQATSIFKVLANTKGSTGYPLIEFRKTTGGAGAAWYPNYTSELILNILSKHKNNPK